MVGNVMGLAHTLTSVEECEEINFKHSLVKITFHLGVGVPKYFKFKKKKLQMVNHFQIRFFYNIEKVLKCKYEKWRSKMYIIIFIFGVQCVPKNIKIFQTTN